MAEPVAVASEQGGSEKTKYSAREEWRLWVTSEEDSEVYGEMERHDLERKIKRWAYLGLHLCKRTDSTSPVHKRSTGNDDRSAALCPPECLSFGAARASRATRGGLELTSTEQQPPIWHTQPHQRAHNPAPRPPSPSSLSLLRAFRSAKQRRPV
ncbi:hypothetical protein RRG08_027754 [Elysia crispata]|uniref:Uncharacterized protein n=1 Tax=Elysia crispata TaxID=231223 RepID=A0AAE0Z931_9GAST|nr:hypothetical protein RRG08_027754 [Elysia crispata]